MGGERRTGGVLGGAQLGAHVLAVRGHYLGMRTDVGAPRIHRAAGGCLRICYYTRSADPSGMGAHMLDLMRAFAGQAQLSILCRTADRARWLFDGATELGALAVPLPSPHDPAYPRVLTDFVRSQQVDVFHGHAGWGWEDPDGFRVAKAEGAAVTLTHHLPFLIHDRRKASRLLETTAPVDRFIAVSDGLRRTYERVGVPSDRFTTVPNGVRPRGNGLGRLAARRALGLRADELVVMTAGRLIKMKGHRYLIDAVPELVRRFPRLAVVILGRGALHDRLHDQAAGLGVGAAVRLLGHRPDARMLLDAADVFVLPSRHEGMPLAAMEAMDAALPVVATRAIGTDEVVADGETGTLVPTEDPGALAAALAGLLADPVRRAAYGAASRRRYREHFTVELMAARTAAVYRDALAASGQSSAAATAASLPVGA